MSDENIISDNFFKIEQSQLLESADIVVNRQIRKSKSRRQEIWHL